MKPGIPEGVKVRQSILHAHYHVTDVGYDTVVQGVSTCVVADTFMAGDPLGRVASFYGIDEADVEAALRWELHDRRWRVERVREYVLRWKP